MRRERATRETLVVDFLSVECLDMSAETATKTAVTGKKECEPVPVENWAMVIRDLVEVFQAWSWKAQEGVEDRGC